MVAGTANSGEGARGVRWRSSLALALLLLARWGKYEMEQREADTALWV
jgi:hypothetical protein